MEELIPRLKELNAEFIPKYSTVECTSEEFIESNTGNSISREIPEADLRYFDLAALNILLAANNTVVYEPPVAILDMISNLTYMANLRCRFFTVLPQINRFCESMSYGHIPDPGLVYQFLNKILRYNKSLADIWFAYILLIWGLPSDRVYDTKPFRSRSIMSFINKSYLTENRSEHEHDLRCDNLRILPNLKGYIELCCNMNKYQGQDFIGYLVESMNLFVVSYLAAIIRRACVWPEFKRLGNIVMYQKSVFHGNVIKLHHEIHKKTGAVNQ